LDFEKERKAAALSSTSLAAAWGQVDNKVLRGGSSYGLETDFRASDRDNGTPAARVNYLGFHCVGVAPGQ
jgi:formylglycine-generating enzyme required for sulfatase activity